MTIRSRQQEIGAFGHRWLMAEIASHPHWIARDLGEDYGIDIEAELAESEVQGEILKIQIKSTELMAHRKGQVKLTIDRQYIEYARSCRYPVILVQVDTQSKQAWYLWLQDWLLNTRGRAGTLHRGQKSWVVWVSDKQTIAEGLSSELKSIASWRGETQLILSLIDALRAAAATHNRAVMKHLIAIIEEHAAAIADVPLDVLINEAIVLGNKIRGSLGGNVIAGLLFALARKFGNRVSRSTITDLVMRGNSFSRIGLTTLGILYDEFFSHIASLGLPAHFQKIESRVAFYCAFREAFPGDKSSNVFVNPSGFTFGGLRYVQPDSFHDKYANRGPSALLDYLVPTPES